MSKTIEITITSIDINCGMIDNGQMNYQITVDGKKINDINEVKETAKSIFRERFGNLPIYAVTINNY